MSYEFWLEAENFLYTQLLIRVVILGIIFMFLFHVFLYRGFNNKKKFYIVFSIITIASIGFSVKTAMDYDKYKVLYDYEKYVNYGMRNNKKSIIGYEKPSYFEKTVYKDLYLLDNFRKVGLYNEEKVEEDVEFLGRDGDKFYFKDKNNINYREIGDYLEIDLDIESPTREGVKFKLKDPKFQEIGFKEKSHYTFLTTYKIPGKMKDKPFGNPKNIEISKQGEILSGWLNPTLGNQITDFKEDK